MQIILTLTLVAILGVMPASAIPAEISPETLAAGKKLYQQNCVFCHQKDAIGKPGFAPSLTNRELLSKVSSKYLASTIRDGRPGTAMAPYAHLGSKNILAIVAYLVSHETETNQSKEIDAQSPARGDPRLGQRWFEQICATCHGPAGNGYLAGGSGTAIGLKGFLDKSSDGLIRETIKKGRSNTRMRAFQGVDGLADLSDQEIDDIISYLRTLNP